MCGRISPHGVIRGLDGLWKLGDLGRAMESPVDPVEWREAHGTSAGDKNEPPEVRFGVEDGARVTTASDLWILGVLLATTILGTHPFESADDKDVLNTRFLVPSGR